MWETNSSHETCSWPCRYRCLKNLNRICLEAHQAHIINSKKSKQKTICGMIGFSSICWWQKQCLEQQDLCGPQPQPYKKNMVSPSSNALGRDMPLAGPNLTNMIHGMILKDIWLYWQNNQDDVVGMEPLAKVTNCSLRLTPQLFTLPKCSNISNQSKEAPSGQPLQKTYLGAGMLTRALVCHQVCLWKTTPDAPFECSLCNF